MLPRNFVNDDPNGFSTIANVNAGTIIVPHITKFNQYFTYGLQCTNLIILSKDVPLFANIASTGRNVSNVFVPDALVNTYENKLGATAKPLSQYNGTYKKMVMYLYNQGVLGRDVGWESHSE